MKKILLCSLFLLVVPEIHGQEAENRTPFINENYGVRMSGYLFIGGGGAVSAAFGYWKTYKYLQPATSISAILSFGKNHLGNNFRKSSTNFQGNIIISSMITSTLNFINPKKKGVYEEIPTLYINNANVIYSNYRSSLTAGTSFVVTPKGFGRNYTTSRNRSQQLAFFQLKGGIGANKSIQFNLVEDVAPESLADKWDRYFTGGGSMQIRVSESIKLKAYSEVYTGTTQRDMIDYPDLTFPFDSVGAYSGRFLNGGIRRVKQYAMQEPSQKVYNMGRMIWGLEITTPINVLDAKKNLFKALKYNAVHSIYYMRQGGGVKKLSKGSSQSHGPMWSQNFIHSWGKGDLFGVIEGDKKSTEKIPFKKSGDKNYLLPKHWFDPYIINRSNTFGYGFGTSF